MLHYFTHGLWIITSGVRALKNASSLSCIYSCPGEAREPWKHGREDWGRGAKGGLKIAMLVQKALQGSETDRNGKVKGVRE